MSGIKASMLDFYDVLLRNIVGLSNGVCSIRCSERLERGRRLPLAVDFFYDNILCAKPHGFELFNRGTEIDFAEERKGELFLFGDYCEDNFVFSSVRADKFFFGKLMCNLFVKLFSILFFREKKLGGGSGLRKKMRDRGAGAVIYLNVNKL